MINYFFNKSNNIIEAEFTGNIEPQGIIDFMKNINQDEQLPDSVLIMIDVRNADFVFEPFAIQNIVKANFRMNKSFKSIKNAFIANNPDDMALTLYKEYVRGSRNYHIKMFKDKHLAENWLKE